jgi:outer membrane protein TolC
VTNAEKPTYSLGLSFIVPLDYKTLNTVRKGYKNDFEAAKKNSESAELVAGNDWDQLLRTWHNVKARLSLGREIQDAQDKRLVNEQNRFERGRSTTFLLLTAENDLDDATLNVYRLVYEELLTAAQADLYNTPANLFGERK